mmetsp:Transcript_1722/g.4843  ORF Transcript_1722/g.4843 Transcript_1722/m.4843 type:complete len:110 (-) Transcript_1722:248-577(-)
MARCELSPNDSAPTRHATAVPDEARSSDSGLSLRQEQASITLLARAAYTSILSPVLRVEAFACERGGQVAQGNTPTVPLMCVRDQATCGTLSITVSNQLQAAARSPPTG